jgi:hypothetical protein
MQFDAAKAQTQGGYSCKTLTPTQHASCLQDACFDSLVNQIALPVHARHARHARWLRQFSTLLQRPLLGVRLLHLQEVEGCTASAQARCRHTTASQTSETRLAQPVALLISKAAANVALIEAGAPPLMVEGAVLVPRPTRVPPHTGVGGMLAALGQMACWVYGCSNKT